ncbi:MAG: exonuclease domain-containing protein [Candidatus Caccosoma sp.]|nr:exonuclease domain-containing protein [Candidatus Caccosoma sp.]
MKYLFFDIEAANSYNFISKMCTFGYVITDDNFKVKSKIDVVMNPESFFDKYILNLHMNAYPLEKYKSAPPFSFFYESIKHILQANNQIVVGWSIENDIKYLSDACKRYKKQQFDFKYIDIQKIMVDEFNLISPPKLQYACEFLKIPIAKTHKSDDDAFMSMQIAKAICLKNKCTLEELISKYEKYISSVSIFNEHSLNEKQLTLKINKKRLAFTIKNYKPKYNLSSPFIKESDVFAISSYLLNDKIDDVISTIHYIINCGAKCAFNFKECNKIICDKKYIPYYKDNIKYNKQEIIDIDTLIIDMKMALNK